MDNATVSAQGEIVIPREVSESIGLRPGDHVGMLVRDGSIWLGPIPSWDELRGIAAGANTEGIREEKDRV